MPASPTPPNHDSGTSIEAALRQRVAELTQERRRHLRQRRVHLLLFGLAVSLPFHIAILVSLASVHRTMPLAGSPTPVVLDLQVLPNERLEEMLDPLDGEEMLTPDPYSDAEESFETEEQQLDATLPSVELAQGDVGALSTVSGGEVGQGLGTGLGAGTGAGASFFGVEGGGSRIAYILDVSASMMKDRRMARAMSELKRSLRALPDYAAFVVVLYNDEAYIAPFQRGWLRASAGNIRRMEQWIDARSPGGGPSQFQHSGSYSASTRGPTRSSS